jgi:sugar O-acyltransferase (sialic acid O-acetyltransferase NeuD family)
MESIVILGAGQQGRICKRLAQENGMDVRAFVDDFIMGEVEGVPVFSCIEEVPNYQDYKYHVAIGEIPPRKKFCEEIERLGLKTQNLIDKTAIVEEGAKLGNGNFIQKFAIIYASAEIGDNNIINCKAICATDAKVGNNNNISMGCNVCGGVEIGDNNYIGCNASLVSGVKVGSDTVIGAASVVLKDVGSDVFVAGAPAVQKERHK